MSACLSSHLIQNTVCLSYNNQSWHNVVFIICVCNFCSIVSKPELYRTNDCKNPVYKISQKSITGSQLMLCRYTDRHARATVHFAAFKKPNKSE